MNRGELWAMLGVGIALAGLLIGVWIELSNDIARNTVRISDNAVLIHESKTEVVREIADLNVTLTDKFADFTAEIAFELSDLKADKR